MVRLLKIQRGFFVVMLRTLVASRIDYYLGTVSMLLVQASSLAFLFIAFSRREHLAGYTRDEALLFFAVAFAVQGLTDCFCEGLWLVGPRYVVGGELDYLLVRPVSPLAQIVMANMHSSGVVPFLLGVALIMHAHGRVAPDATALERIALFYQVFVGFLIQFAIILALTSLSFLYGRVTALIAMLATLRQFFAYPLDIFPRAVLLVFTLVIPLAFASYFPVLEALRPGGGRALAFSLEVTALALVALAAALHCWNRGVMRYQSAQG